MSRVHQVLLIVTFLPVCWLLMMAVHELGHVIGARCTNGTVTKVVLHPLAISRTDVNPNPAPNVVVWAGPIIGCLLPIVVLIMSCLRSNSVEFLIRFFVGFCLIANGAYVAFGSFNGIGDAGDMLKSGSPMWYLWLFGLITIPAGLLLWHGLGPHFGLGESKGRVSHTATYLSLAILILTLAAELMLSPTS
jgi:hypothetical protein